MPTAIVTGATGILGREIVARLGSNPERWTTVHALSRSQKDEYPPSVQHQFLDLTSTPADMARQLDGIAAEYVFFAAYLAQDSEEDATRVNGDMLQNFLRALEASPSGLSQLRRIVLVTGCKQYGVHLGAPKNPMREDDTWLRDDCFPPNFYYRQQDVLHDFCSTNARGRVAWTVTYPNDVVGFARGNFMNLATAVGIYAAVTREMQQQQQQQQEGLIFPGSERFYSGFDSMTGAALHAEFCEWAALEPRAANQAFNVVNGDVVSWQDMWPRLAARFGLRVKPDQFAASSSAEAASASSSSALNDPPPLSVFAKKAGLKGTAAAEAPSRLEQRVDLVRWSRRDDVRAAWEALAAREGLERDAFDKATWGFLGFVLGRAYDLVISMSKARGMGWTGYRDTWEDLSGVLDRLEDEGVLPRTARGDERKHARQRSSVGDAAVAVADNLQLPVMKKKMNKPEA